MKEMLEEYGGIITACFFSLLFLVFITVSVGKNGVLSNYILVYLESTGTQMIDGGD